MRRLSPERSHFLQSQRALAVSGSGGTTGGMRLFPVLPILWSSLLVLCASQSEREDNYPDVCGDEGDPGNIHGHNPPGQVGKVEEAQVYNKYRCLLYPTNILNCSWSFLTLQKDAQLYVNISTHFCDGDREVRSMKLSSEERAGWRSLILPEDETLYVILKFNISLHGQWTVYTSEHDMDILEVLPPPPNVSASVKDGGLLVTWGLPLSRGDINARCFDYQLYLGEQEQIKNLSEQLSYTEPNVDPAATYSVRMRTRKSFECQHSSHWSAWSRTVPVEPLSLYKVSTLVIVSISLGIPMILLAVLLGHQRVIKLLFPPIPRPPPKYKVFLEKNDAFSLFRPAPPAEPVEEITEVEDGQRP